MKIKKKYLINISLTFLLISTFTLIIYLTKSSILKETLFHLYLIPVIISSYKFGFKGAFTVAIICSFAYAPDYMLFIGEIKKEQFEIYLKLIKFNVVSIIFGFFIEKWQVEKNKLANSNKNLFKINEELKELLKLKEIMEKQERLAALGTISSNIAHELRNPLSIIKTSIASLSKDLLNNEEVIETKSVIDEEIHKATTIINSILNLAKESEIIFNKINVTKLINSVIKLIHPFLIQKKADVIFNESNGIIIEGDEQKLSRVFFNLITNAADAVEEQNGGWIKISIKEKNESIKINIEDSGSGIKETAKNKIFNPFYSTKNSGTGLGLSISNSIINEHNGKIDCSNTANGALFTITLNKKIKKDEKIE